MLFFPAVNKSAIRLIRWTLLVLLFSCSSLTVIKHDLPIPSGNHPWPVFGGDLQRTNYRQKPLSQSLQNSWIYKASSAIGPTLVAVDGIVYLASLDGRVDAVDIKTGEQIGRLQTQDDLAATCAYVDGKLVLGARYGEETLSLYNLSSGEYLWSVNAGDIASEPLVTEREIYIAALYNHIDKFNLKTGEKIWSFATEDQHRSSPALSDGILVVGCDNGTIYALNSKTGSLKWKVKTNASVFATPVIEDEKVYIGSADSIFYALDLYNGSVIWKFQGSVPFYQTAATDGENVVFGASDGQFYCLDAERGDKKWSFFAESVISTAPVISGDVVFFGSLDQKYYCLSLEDGSELWSFKTEGRIRTSPIVWGKYLLGASEDRYLYAFASSDSVLDIKAGPDKAN